MYQRKSRYMDKRWLDKLKLFQKVTKDITRNNTFSSLKCNSCLDRKTNKFY